MLRINSRGVPFASATVRTRICLGRLFCWIEASDVAVGATVVQHAERQRKKPRGSDTAMTEARRRRRRVLREVRALECEEEEGGLAIGVVRVIRVVNQIRSDLRKREGMEERGGSALCSVSVRSGKSEQILGEQEQAEQLRSKRIEYGSDLLTLVAHFVSEHNHILQLPQTCHFLSCQRKVIVS